MHDDVDNDDPSHLGSKSWQVEHSIISATLTASIGCSSLSSELLSALSLTQLPTTTVRLSHISPKILLSSSESMKSLLPPICTLQIDTMHNTPTSPINRDIYKLIVFENHRKSRIQDCKRCELRLHFECDKSSLKMPKMVHFSEFLKSWSLRSNSVTRQVSLVVNSKIPNFNWDIFGWFSNTVIWGCLDSETV